MRPESVVYLDANVLIYLSEGSPEQQARITEILEPYEARQARFVTSELTLAEVMVIPIRTGNERQIGVYEELFDEFVQLLATTRETWLMAAKLRAETPSRRMPDAIHVATATLALATVFVTGDQGIKSLPEGIETILV